MRFRADRDELADAVAWAARALPARPAVPVLAGMVVDAGEELRVSCFDHEVSARAVIGLGAGEPGRALVSGRLLAEIARSLPSGPVEIAGDGAGVTVTADGTTFTLPAMPLEDHPALPQPRWGVRAETARLGFTQGAARALITDGDYRCVLMPVRLAA